MSDQPKPMFPNLRPSASGCALAVRLLFPAIVGSSLLGMAGLTLTGTMIALVVATPVLVLFSPVIISAIVVLSLIFTGFMFSGGFLAAAVAAMTCVYRYLGQRRRFPWVGELDYARMNNVASKAGDVKERAKDKTQELIMQGS